jgi:hypothetical protein
MRRTQRIPRCQPPMVVTVRAQDLWTQDMETLNVPTLFGVRAWVSKTMIEAATGQGCPCVWEHGGGGQGGSGRPVLLLEGFLQIVNGDSEVGTHPDSCTQVQAVGHWI